MRTSLFARCFAAGLVLAAIPSCHSDKPSPETAHAAAGDSGPPDAEPGAFGPAAIDAMMRAEWAKAGVSPAPRVDDAGFLRRVTIDLTGTIPSPEEVTHFSADPSADKREKLVEALLASPGYVERWTDYWDDVLLGPQVRARYVDRDEFRAWLATELTNNAPWNKMVLDLVTATGLSRSDTPDDPAVNGAVNWIMKYGREPQDLAGATSRVFLGVQIQCAQCHDHKTEKWKQDDFRAFAASFARTKGRPAGGQGRSMRFDVQDVNHRLSGGPQSPTLTEITDTPPKTLDGAALPLGAERRRAMAEWLTAEQNPWFASAIVNRLWGEMLGVGFVEPVDDIRPGNPAAMPDLLAKVAADFVAHDHDLKHLFRTICATEAYQLSSAPLAKEPKEDAPKEAVAAAAWARFSLKPLPPDLLVRSIVKASGIDAMLDRVAGQRAEKLIDSMRNQFSFLFDVDGADEPHDTYEGTIPQALLLQNGRLTSGASTAIAGSRLASLIRKNATDEEKVDELYLAALSRPATTAERARWLAFLAAPRAAASGGEPGSVAFADDDAPGDDEMDDRGGMGGPMRPNQRQNQRPNQRERPAQAARGQGMASMAKTDKDRAYEDLFWALLNTSEFSFNH